mmetsp:Transcript_5498/g.21471  ORF Transcript_5498/g.21471 Transcript_5498/m.21471 type:complete len:222 (-) Transcript_5498:2062-2727(-)
MSVLIVLQSRAVRERVPVFSDRELGIHRLDVLSGELSAVTLREIKAHSSKADVVSQPLEPLGQVAANAFIRMIDVGRPRELIARRVVTLTCEVRIPIIDGPLTPVHTSSFPTVPLAPSALVRGAAMVQHGVEHGQNVVLLAVRDEVSQSLFRTVRTIQRIHIARQVALRCERIRRRRQPNLSKSRLIHFAKSVLHNFVPIQVVAFPVETLDHDLAPSRDAR